MIILSGTSASSAIEINLNIYGNNNNQDSNKIKLSGVFLIIQYWILLLRNPLILIFQMKFYIF
jgi:hypothetical protein